jgi:hypothetical protein
MRTESSTYSCASERSDSEGENRRSAVHTEVVVEAPTRNVLNVAIPAKQETVIKTREIQRESDSEDGQDGGVNLQSIMAQV